MVAVKVCRDGSSVDQCLEDDSLLNWGDDIRDVLITEEVIAIERGRVEIDANHKNKQIVSGTLAKLAINQPTDLIKINESQGRLLSLKVRVTDTSRQTLMQMESLL